MQKHIFRSSDIRGVVGVDFFVQEVYMLTQSMVIWFSKNHPSVQRIAVAFDGRLHGYEIYQQVAQAIIDAGYQVYFLGICPTPVFMYGLYQLPVQAGIMITASGSSAQFNGFKLFLDKNLVQAEQLHELYALHLQRMIVSDCSLTIAEQSKIIPCPIIEQYVDMLWQEFAHLSQYDFSIMLDCGHGSTGPIIYKLIQRMKWKMVDSMNDLIDGDFPIHNPEPFDTKNLLMLHAEVKKRKKSFGIAFDGDGDRMLGVLPNGTIVLGDSLLTIFAQDILGRNAHRSIVYDIQSIDSLADIISKSHGKPVLVSKGLFSMTQAMQSEQVVLGGQLHGRFFFKDRHIGYADGIYAFFRLLDILIQQRQSLSDLLTPLLKIQHNFSQLDDVSNKITKEY